MHAPRLQVLFFRFKHPIGYILHYIQIPSEHTRERVRVAAQCSAHVRQRSSSGDLDRVHREV